jgi:hypothetical protein
LHGATANKLEAFNIRPRQHYFLVDAVVRPRTRDGKPIEKRCIVLRPSLVEQIWRLPTVRTNLLQLREPPGGIILGRAALADESSFREAADLLAFFVLGVRRGRDGKATMGYGTGASVQSERLVRRTVTKTGNTWRWTGTIQYKTVVGRRPHPGMIAIVVGGKVVTRSYELVLEANRDTRELHILTTFPHARHAASRSPALRLTSSPVSGDRGRWVLAAERLAWKGHTFFNTFPPARELGFAMNRTKPIQVLKTTNGRKVNPCLVQTEEEARRAAETLMAQRRKRVHPSQRAHVFIPKSVAGVEKCGASFRVRVRGERGGRATETTYLALSATAFRAAVGMPREWRKAQGHLFGYYSDAERLRRERAWKNPNLKRVREQRERRWAGVGPKLSEGALSDPRSFAEAMDLIAYVMLRGDIGYVLEREVDAAALRWTGTVAEVPATLRRVETRADWRFTKVHLTVNRATGEMTLRKEALGRMVDAGSVHR